jgi:WD40 repeat protein
MTMPGRTSLLIAACSCGVVLMPLVAGAQGLPDIVWQNAGHTHSVEGVAFTGDGLHVVSGSDYDDCTFKLWSAADGSLAKSFSVYPHGIQSVDTAPGGAGLVAVGYIVTGYPPGGVAAVWDTELGMRRFTAGGCHVAFSPDGDILASGGGGVNRYLALTRVADGVELHTIHTGSYILDVAYSPDGQLVATAGSDNVIKFWSPANGNLVRTLAGHTDDVSAVAFSPDGEIIASGAGGWDNPGESSIRLWRVADGELVRVLAGHGEWVASLAFSPDGSTLASSGRTGPTPAIKLWRAADGELIQTYDDSAHDIAFSPDGRTFAYGRATGDVVLAENPEATTSIAARGVNAAMWVLGTPSPNPFHSSSVLRFDLEQAGAVRLTVHDVTGRHVATLVDETMAAGGHAVQWAGRDADGERVTHGIYFARLTAAGQVIGIRKILMLR